MTKLNEQTTIPLWSVIVAVPILVSAISYTALVSYKTNTNADVIVELKREQNILKEDQNNLKNSTLVFMSDIKTSLAVIESRLNQRK
jgi:hypothetical protein